MPTAPTDTAKIARVPPVTIRAGTSLFVAVILTTAGYYFLPTAYHDILLFFAAACAAAGQIALAFYSARILQLTANIQAETSRKSLDTESLTIKHRALDLASRFGERWNDASLFHMRRQCATIISKRHSPDDIKKEIKSSPDVEANVRHALNFFEELSLQVLQGRCDEPTAKDLFCSLALTMWQCAEGWIREERSTSGRAKAWVQLEKLHERWK